MKKGCPRFLKLKDAEDAGILAERSSKIILSMERKIFPHREMRFQGVKRIQGSPLSRSHSLWM